MDKKTYDKNSYLSNPDKFKAKSAEYRKNNPEKIKEQTKKYIAKNSDKIKQTKKEYNKQFPEKQKVRIDRWKENNPNGFRKSMLKRKYGITHDEYLLILEEQNYKCAICLTETAGGRGSFPVDHDHITGKVRGLLCNSCNLGIGMLKDDTTILAKAIKYLQKHGRN